MSEIDVYRVESGSYWIHDGRTTFEFTSEEMLDIGKWIDGYRDILEADVKARGRGEYESD